MSHFRALRHTSITQYLAIIAAILLCLTPINAKFPRKIPSQKPARVSHDAAIESTIQSSSSETLAFITPWHHSAYALQIPFDFIAPVWFRIAPSGTALQIHGEGDVNHGWMRKMRLLAQQSVSNAPRIVPRFSLEQFTQQEHYQALLITQRTTVIQQIAALVQKYQLDGVTLELGFLQYGAVAQFVEGFLKELHEALRKKASVDRESPVIILVVPSQEQLMSSAEVRRFAPWVHRFFVMTYDYTSHSASPGTPGPVSPLYWMKSTMQRLCGAADDCSHLMMGVNFYGYHYTSRGTMEPIIGDKYLEVLRENNAPQPQLDAQSKEHYVKFKDAQGHQHTIYYPTESDIRARVQLARELGTGVGIWELGQGLKEFFSVFG